MIYSKHGKQLKSAAKGHNLTVRIRLSDLSTILDNSVLPDDYLQKITDTMITQIVEVETITKHQEGFNAHVSNEAQRG